MNVKNIKSFVEFYKFLGVTDCISQTPRNKGNAEFKFWFRKTDSFNFYR